MSQFFQDSIFWVEVDKIKPNPFQPRREFNEAELKSLADSIRQYGVLQALVVTKKEVPKEDGGLTFEYELIAGERRLRASRLAGLAQVPVLIKSGDESDLMKLELAIIENLQREDLNVVERARAFKKLWEEFSLSHAQIGQKVGKSRSYVTNTIRILDLPEEIITALSAGKISEGHTRPLGMLADRPEEQNTLLKEIIFKKLNVRETEDYARRIAFERIKNKNYIQDPEIVDMERKMSESLGTRVTINRKENGGKISIDFFSMNDLEQIVELMKKENNKDVNEMMNRFISEEENSEVADMEESQSSDDNKKEQDDEDMYSVNNFSV